MLFKNCAPTPVPVVAAIAVPSLILRKEGSVQCISITNNTEWLPIQLVMKWEMLYELCLKDCPVMLFGANKCIQTHPRGKHVTAMWHMKITARDVLLHLSIAPTLSPTRAPTPAPSAKTSVPTAGPTAMPTMEQMKQHFLTETKPPSDSPTDSTSEAPTGMPSPPSAVPTARSWFDDIP
jgi:hypothetical protein